MSKNERMPLVQKQDAHFEIVYQTSNVPFTNECVDEFNDIDMRPNEARKSHERNGATVFQTSLNIAKLCMGTGTLALPFAAQKGGLVLNMLGLAAIAIWNYYSADCLLRCLEYIPDSPDPMNELAGSSGPPSGTTAYGVVAWHAFGKAGLFGLDSLMIMLSVGLLIAYQAAIYSFIDEITQHMFSRVCSKILSSLIIIFLSCSRDGISFLSKFSAFGLLALAASFGVIFREGVVENEWVGFADVRHLNLWPESVSAASSWFGIVVFGYGIVPFIFSFKDSMKDPNDIDLSTKIGLGIVYLGYLFVSDCVRILYSPTHSFDGDVLQALPDSMISSAVRLLMIAVVCVTAPLIAVPCGEMIEGKLNNDQNSSLHHQIWIRISLCGICMILAAFVPGFVHVISFIGCCCVSILSFVLPPLFSIQLKKGKQEVCPYEFGLLALGLLTTVVTSAMTFRNLTNT